MSTQVTANCSSIPEKEPLNCTTEPIADIVPENVFVVMKTAKRSEEAFKQCLRILQSHTKAALSSKSFKEAVHPSVLDLLKLPTLNLDREVQLLEAIITWIESKKRDLFTKDIDEYHGFLKKLFLRYIDIRSISAVEFVDVVERHPRFFTESEITAVLMNLVKPSSWALPEGWGSGILSQTLFYSENSIHKVFEDFQKYAWKLRTTTGMFKHCGIVASTNNAVRLSLEVKLSAKFLEEDTNLVMIELAFGNDTIPVKDFKIDLVKTPIHDRLGTGTVEIGYWLVCVEGCYVLMLKNPEKLHKGRSLHLEVVLQLHKASPDFVFGNLNKGLCGKSVLNKAHDLSEVRIRLMSNELVFFSHPLTRDIKEFFIAALYVDTCKDYKMGLVRKPVPKS